MRVTKVFIIVKLFQYIQSQVLRLSTSLNFTQSWPLVALLVGVIVGIIRVLVVVLVSLVVIADNLININASKF